ncbi:hypothetical protein ACVH9Z_12665 [Rhodococcus opacus]|uniref:hypothetical protein n=1 Tax=Rhodococcus TaxID=1827 RepID=UPI0006BB522F|nr:hypothetical protein [Rhodococcus opacus]
MIGRVSGLTPAWIRLIGTKIRKDGSVTNDVPESEQSLVDLVLELADADDQLSEEVGLIVLAALELEGSQSDALDSETAAA